MSHDHPTPNDICDGENGEKDSAKKNEPARSLHGIKLGLPSINLGLSNLFYDLKNLIGGVHCCILSSVQAQKTAQKTGKVQIQQGNETGARLEKQCSPDPSFVEFLR
jgi:hypothetical protein